MCFGVSSPQLCCGLVWGFTDASEVSAVRSVRSWVSQTSCQYVCGGFLEKLKKTCQLSEFPGVLLGRLLK